MFRLSLQAPARLFRLFRLSLAAALGASAASAAPVPSWQVLWADEFEVAGRPDPTKWRIQVGPSTVNGEAQYYSDRLQNLEVKDGRLHIIARKENFGGRSYTSARLDTETKAWWTYSRFEFRAKLAGGKGAWPALWSLAHNCASLGGWPACGEIDIAEYAGKNPDRVNATLHMRDINYRNRNNPHGSAILADVSGTFHTYAMEWHPDRIDFWMDTLKVLTFRNDGKGFGSWPYTNPQYLIMNVALGGGYGGPIDDAIFPTQSVIEYVRVYKEGPVALLGPVRDAPSRRAPETALGPLGSRAGRDFQGRRRETAPGRAWPGLLLTVP